MKIASKAEISDAFRQARAQGFLDDEDTLAVFMDLSVLEDRIARLTASFPEGALHAVAVKTNPLLFVLRHLAGLGVGLEAASFGEVLMATKAGLSKEKLVLNSPAKTRTEIEILRRDFPGIRVNADSLSELDRYASQPHPLKIGLRVNPLIKSDAVDYMSTGGESSKFGEPISNREAIIKTCLGREDIDGLHMHIGSQYTDLTPTLRAARAILDLAADINSMAARRKITTIDIGGGFPVNYGEGPPYLIENYANALRKTCPDLFDGTFEVITEFGRYVHAHACWSASTVEYVKEIPGGVNLITHAGADMFLRECYNPGDWAHEIFVLDSEGREKKPEHVKANIAGPLCFGGDVIEYGIDLPRAEPGDTLVIRDIGANTFSLWSRHCSRPFPKVISYRGDGGAAEMKIAKLREDYPAIIDFWS